MKMISGSTEHLHPLICMQKQNCNIRIRQLCPVSFGVSGECLRSFLVDPNVRSKC